MKTPIAFACFLLITCGINAQTLVGDKDDLAQILANISQFSTDLVRGDHSAIAQAYCEDASILPGGRDIIKGRADIEKYWMPSSSSSTSHHKIMPVEIIVKGDTAYDHGYYEGTSKNKDGSETNWSGKYVIVWKNIAGSWMIYLDIWNRRAAQ